MTFVDTSIDTPKELKPRDRRHGTPSDDDVAVSTKKQEDNNNNREENQ